MSPAETKLGESTPFDPRFVQGVGFKVTEEKLLGYGLFYKTNRWFGRHWIVQEVANTQHI